MAGTGSGVKNPNRLTSFVTPLALYRVVTVQDGAVNPAAPPSVALINAAGSPRGLNDLVLLVEPTAGDQPILQLWIVVDGKWYFVSQAQVSGAGRPERMVMKDIPACEWAVVVTVCAGPVRISYVRTS
jgi:hypothetical protein